ncbi:MAG: zinc-ribbon domain-containing protein [Lachnospiraceae bacterium]|nr:zinc-ribbon domain-containing protein [Lachnospiraceae bacterium]
MGYCNNCGKEIPEGVKFCSYCGAPVVNRANDQGLRPDITTNNGQQRQYRYEEPCNGVLDIIDRFGKYYGIALLILSIVFMFSDPPFLRLFLSIIIIAGAVFCLIRKYKLKGFAIAAMVLAFISFLIGVSDAKDHGLLGNKDKYNDVHAIEDNRDYSYDEEETEEEASKPASDTGKDEEDVVIEEEPEGSPTEMKSDENKESVSDEPEKEKEKQEEEEKSEDADDSKDSNTVDPDLKDFLDSYEAFIDEYVAFLKEYNSDTANAASMIGDYAKMMQRYADFAEKLDRYDSDTMSTADAKYYIEVTSRCTQKLLEVE